MSRRDFLAQGFCAGMGTVLGGSVLSMFANPKAAHAALSSDLELADPCLPSDLQTIFRVTGVN